MADVAARYQIARAEHFPLLLNLPEIVQRHVSTSRQTITIDPAPLNAS
jgi:hypothetical protein